MLAAATTPGQRFTAPRANCSVWYPVNKQPAPWWHRDAHLWIDVHSERELLNALESDEDCQLVAVEWFTSRCLGCRVSAPHLAALASDPDLKPRVRFVRAHAEGMVSVARRQGARRLPHMVVFATGGRQVAGFSAAASKRDTWREKVDAALQEGDAPMARVAASMEEVPGLSNGTGTGVAHLREEEAVQGTCRT